MALSKAELQAVMQAAINVPPNVRSEVHFTFSADFIVSLFNGLIDLVDANQALAVEKEAAVAELMAARAVKAEEPLPESLPIASDGEGL